MRIKDEEVITDNDESKRGSPHVHTNEMDDILTKRNDHSAATSISVTSEIIHVPNPNEKGDNRTLLRPAISDVTKTAVVGMNPQMEYENNKQGPSTPQKRRQMFTVISPTKTWKKRKVGSGDPIRTFVFMDFETTDLISGYVATTNRFNNKLADPHNYTELLRKVILETQMSDYPRITEMSFISIGRDMIPDALEQMRKKSSNNEVDLRIHIPCNVHTRQINPDLNEVQWKKYDRDQQTIPAIVHKQSVLKTKNTFAKEWPGVRMFLETCEKPACLVAHNGLYFDYRVLYSELQRNGFIDNNMGMPDGIYFIDSLMAVREIESEDRANLCKTISDFDWTMITQNVLTRASAVENIPDAVNEEEDIPNTAPMKVEAPITPTKRSWTKINTTTPEKPAAERTCSTEPKNPKLDVRRRCFERVARDDHPLLFFNTEEWSPAKKRRIRGDFFELSNTGTWKFNRTLAERVNKDGLHFLYGSVIKGTYHEHYAQDDTEALLQVCLAFDKSFIDYADAKAAEFPF